MATELKGWISERSGEVRSLQIAWERATSVAVEAGWSNEAILGIAREIDHPASLIKLCESAALGKVDGKGSVLRMIESNADDSVYSTSEWIRALESLLQFLIRENRSSKLEVQMGYLACSGEYLSISQPPYSFSEVVSRFLDEYGFEG